SEHPTPAELEGFLCGALDDESMERVASHVLGGCEICRANLSSGGELQESVEEERVELQPEVDAAYDRALGRAFTTALRHGRHAANEAAKSRQASALLVSGGIEKLAAAPRSLKGLAAYQALLTRCEEVRHDDPEQAVQLAIYATLVAGRLSVHRYGVRQVA